ncbi:hypothetical protein BDZ45DRAFT_743918 [Acephala macrosclerotiorum]|nr:hypothetical protein BDZ45DRAFT_743918 [Acephala macrosclerotiorum]
MQSRVHGRGADPDSRTPKLEMELKYCFEESGGINKERLREIWASRSPESRTGKFGITNDSISNIKPRELAHTLDPESKWLVLGFDYPLLPASALQQLILEYEDPVTCFVNREEFAEPLIGIWSPNALRKLGENVEVGRSGLGTVVKEVGGKMVRPLREGWIKGTNTREEWEEVLEILRGDETGV